jgi:hypothetical protein
MEQRIALIHELAHALADQQFSLAHYIRKGNQSDDDSTAREAVMEGQATWLMWAYSSKLNGGDPEPSEIIMDTMKDDAANSSAQFPVLDNAPLYLRESLVFPYNQGLLFQQAVFLKLGKAGFSEVFRHAPRSTAQIIHPALYFEKRQAPALQPPQPPSPKSYRTLAQGSVGEFDHRVLLEQYLSREDAAVLAPHWTAGQFRLYEHKTNKKPVLAYESEWDSPATARRFFDAMHRIFEAKSKQVTFDPPAENQFTGLNTRGRFQARLNASRVSTLEGN